MKKKAEHLKVCHAKHYKKDEKIAKKSKLVKEALNMYFINKKCFLEKKVAETTSMNTTSG